MHEARIASPSASSNTRRINSADIGLGGLRPGERVRFGAGNPTTAQFEDVLNALRLAPVIQFGVSYAF